MFSSLDVSKAQIMGRSSAGHIRSAITKIIPANLYSLSVK